MEGICQQFLLNENVQLMQKDVAGRSEKEYNKIYYKRDSIKKLKKEYRQQEYRREYERNSQRKSRLQKSILKMIENI
jgi:uncharacterized membrane protein YgaE (UPF0421/DUF939 family)